MFLREIPLPSEVDPDAWEGLVARSCRSLGLTPSVRTTLRGRPGSIHWHFKMRGERGTLEVTLLSESITIAVHDNRRGPWTDGAVADVSAMIEAGLSPREGRAAPGEERIR